MGQMATTLFPTAAAQQQQHPDDVPWMLRYGARGTGAVAGFISIVFGVWACFPFIFPMCLVGGMLQMLVGFFIVLIEAPCCCLFIEHVQRLSAWADAKAHWQKAILYVLLALPAPIMCFGISTIMASALIILTAVLYGMMSLGKKASREEMINRAQSDQQINQEMKVNLMSEQQARTAEAGGDFHQI